MICKVELLVCKYPLGRLKTICIELKKKSFRVEINKNETLNCTSLCQNQYEDPSILASRLYLIIICLWCLVSKQEIGSGDDKAKHIFHGASCCSIIGWSFSYTFLVTPIDPVIRWIYQVLSIVMCANLFLDEFGHDYIDFWKRSWADSAKSSNKNEFHFHESAPVGETYLHVNGFARRLVLIQRQKATRKCPLRLTNWIRNIPTTFNLAKHIILLRGYHPMALWFDE